MAQTLRRRYSPEEIERGLAALVIAGSSIEASKAVGISDSTLREWKMLYPDQYTRLQKDLEPKIVDKIAGEAESIVLRLAALQHAYIDEMITTLPQLKPGELPGAARNIATVSALYVDKHSSPLRERPSHVQPTTDHDGNVRKLARILGIDVEGTATEIVDATPLKTESDKLNPRELDSAG